MKTVTKLKNSMKNPIPFFFVMKYVIGTFLIFSLAFVLLKFPENSASGIRNGIDLCLDVLVPTLYPFMILTNIFINSGFITKVPGFISKLTRLIFRLPGECASVIFFSMIGGLPVGAKMTQNLFSKNIITQEQGKRMLCFCINPGPAFVISSVGYYMLGSKEVGILIFFSLVASSLTIGVITGLFSNGKEVLAVSVKSESTNKNIFQSSVADASKSILSVCSWVVAFSCISEMINLLDISDSLRVFLQCFTEMTNGCKTASEVYSAPVLAGVIGFGGICAHFQIMDSITAVKMKYKHFFVARVINGSLATVYCSLLLKWFPAVNETFSAGIKPSEKGISTSVLTSVLMILMAVLFIIGDDYSVKKTGKNKPKNKV